MDVSAYELEDLLLAAIKSEVESKSVYAALADMVKNAFLKDRMKFLASEEERHRIYIEGIFAKEFPGKEIVLPEKTPVPLPVVEIPDESVPLSVVFESAMEAEKASSEFYKGLAGRYDDPEITEMLSYFASMEMNHFKILEAEQDIIQRFEDFDIEWPMMNVGP